MERATNICGPLLDVAGLDGGHLQASGGRPKLGSAPPSFKQEVALGIRVAALQ